MLKSFNRSQKYLRTYDIKFLKPLLKIAHIFALYPPYDFDKKIIYNRTFYKLYSILFALLVIVLATISFDGRFESGLEFNSITLIFLSVGSQFTLLLFNVTAILGSAIWNYEKYYKLLDYFVLLECQLEKCDNEKPWKSFKLIFLHSHFWFSIVCLSDVYLWIYDQKNKFYYHLFQKLQFYFGFLIAMVMRNFVNSVKNKFELLADVLMKKEITLMQPGKIKKDTKIVSFLTIEDIKYIRNIYVNLSDIVSTMNEIFGLVLMCLILVMLLSALYAVDLVLVNGNENHRIILVTIMWTGFCLVSIFCDLRFEAP